MRLLILGGTRFLGRHLVTAALAGGHEVTLFNRRKSNPELFPDLEQLQGDRDGSLAALEGRHWDAAIDTCGYVPRIVSASAQLLSTAVNHYTFISSISVYADFSQVGVDEDAPVAQLADETTEQVHEFYGELKARCEAVVEQSMPGRSLLVRPGLIVGPFDPTDRFTYWVRRVAAGGEILAPGNPNSLQQFIDVRDLAEWIIALVAANQTGVFNATGPQNQLTLGNLLELCLQVAGVEGKFSWVSEEFLIEQGVQAWTELPLWVPGELAGFSTVSIAKAIEAGLTFRPLAETIRDTLTWSQAHGPLSATTLQPQREQQLLRLWHEMQKI